MAASHGDWAGLPEHILDLIVPKLGRLSDYPCFAVVCRAWLSVINLNPGKYLFFNILKISRKNIPMLIVKTDENNDEKRGLYNLVDRITYSVQLPLPYKSRFIGSSHGWLLCLDKNLVITLLDPFNNKCLSLPPLKDASQVFPNQFRSESYNYYISKAILTSDPRISLDNFEVVVMHHSTQKLAYYKADERCWKFCDLERNRDFGDIIFYKGYIYALSLPSLPPELLRIDIQSGKFEKIVSASKSEGDCFYLVESQDGELLLVTRYWIDHNSGYEFPKTFKFKVFKLVNAIDQQQFAIWEEVEDIGEQALFVGDGNLSVSISTRDCSKFASNSVYFSAHDHIYVGQYDYRGSDEDSGVFHLGDKSFHSHHVLDPLEKYVQPAIWFVPNFQ